MANHLSEAAREHQKAYNRRYCKERYHWLKNSGYCVTCGWRYAEPGRTRCKECNERMETARKPKHEQWYAGRKALRAYRKEHHICVTCGIAAAEGHTMCEKCLARKREFWHVQRIMKKIAAEVQAARERSRA